MTFFTFSVLLLAALLFVPASQLIWVLSVRRLERKLQKTLDKTERQQQLKRARIVSLLVCLIFSFLFNFYTLGAPMHG